MTQNVSSFLQLARPKHSIKNLIILVPWAISGTPFTAPLLATVVAFILVSSGIYAVNDAIDSEYDRNHPTKFFRPVASKRITTTASFYFAASCFTLALIVSLIFFWPTAVLGAIYVAVNIAYSAAGKDVPVLDILMVSSGFVVRCAAGILAVGPIEETSWIIVPVFLAATGLALGKRLAKRAKAGSSSETIRMPVFYTESNLRGMLFFLSHLSVLVGGWLLIDDRIGLANRVQISHLSVGVLALTSVVVLSRVVYLIVHRHMEPATAFTADGLTMLGAGVLASTLMIDSVAW